MAEKVCCPHCGSNLKAFALPDSTGWDGDRQWACFNNDCSYYKDGWEWMMDTYNVKASYRYRVCDLEAKSAKPLAVWSEEALCDRIIENEDNT